MLKLKVNGEERAVDVSPDTPLLWVVRETLGLTGTNAQMESGVAFGLTAALYGAITFEKGRVQQRNFHDYPILRMNEMPEVEAHIVPSTEKMGGVGETGVPPIAPAVANALFALTGKRVRRLPIRAEDLTKA